MRGVQMGMTISERIAGNAKYICKRDGVRLADLEAAIGVSTGYLSRIKGRRMLPIEIGYAIATYLNVEMDELVSTDLKLRDEIAAARARLVLLKLKMEESENGKT